MVRILALSEGLSDDKIQLDPEGTVMCSSDLHQILASSRSGDPSSASKDTAHCVQC